MEDEKFENIFMSKIRQKCSKSLGIKILCGFLILFSIHIITWFYSMISPIKNEKLSCMYKSKFNKIVCTQTGDIVPKWLDLKNSSYLSFWGINNDSFPMELIFSKSENDYIALNMVHKEFIEGLNRKFIYEIPEQTLLDWINFKSYVESGIPQNYGAIVLYCSDTRLTEDICKNLKKNYKGK